MRLMIEACARVAGAYNVSSHSWKPLARICARIWACGITRATTSPRKERP